MKKTRTLILGAGPTGLGAALRLNELGDQDWQIIDAAPAPGGLARSFKDPQGFTWDIGGHVQFSHYEVFDEWMDRALGADGWISHERESWVWMRDRFIPYPFQNNIRHLPKEEVWSCVRALLALHVSPKPPDWKPANFGEWIDATFGEGIGKVFMRPYNYKVWAFPPEDMTYGWIGERVAVTDLSRVLENILLSKDDLSWGPNAKFRFPKEGGTGRIWERIADLAGRARIRLDNAVTGISLKDKKASLADGSVIQFDRCLSTIPLDSLVGIAKESGSAEKALASRLRFSTSNIVGVGMEGRPPPALATKAWMYFPEDDCPFYRVTVFSNYSPKNVPDAKTQWSLMAEVSESPKKPLRQEKLVEDVIQGLRNTKLLPAGQKILSQWAFRAGHGYPTPFLGRDDVLKGLHSFFEPHGVFSRGRFGGWKYEVSNQDHSFMQGWEWVGRMDRGEEEVTYFKPAVANAGRGRPVR